MDLKWRTEATRPRWSIYRRNTALQGEPSMPRSAGDSRSHSTYYPDLSKQPSGDSIMSPEILPFPVPRGPGRMVHQVMITRTAVQIDGVAREAAWLSSAPRAHRRRDALDTAFQQGDTCRVETSEKQRRGQRSPSHHRSPPVRSRIPSSYPEILSFPL
jgi:hypothetical protein